MQEQTKKKLELFVLVSKVTEPKAETRMTHCSLWGCSGAFAMGEEVHESGLADAWRRGAERPYIKFA